jgi:hypothetical protein
MDDDDKKVKTMNHMIQFGVFRLDETMFKKESNLSFVIVKITRFVSMGEITLRVSRFCFKNEMYNKYYNMQ